MTSMKNIIVVAAVSVILSVAHLGSAQAADGVQTMKPLHGVSFHSGTKHAVAYFLSESGTCRLVFTLADDTNFAPARIEAAIDAGKSTVYQFAADKSLKFVCQAEAQTMDVTSLETTAAN